MKLKKPLEFGEWSFYLEKDDGTDMRIPAEGFAKSRIQLLNAVHAIFEAFASQGKPEYKQAAEEEAKKMKIAYGVYLGKMIEHQICLRNGGIAGGKCYASGIGDKLHAFAKKIDKVIDKSPSIVQKAFEKVVEKTLNPQKTKVVEGQLVRATKPRLGGCSACGGRSSFSKKGKNMGRAGRMQ